ncbi:LexA family protein [Paenibacillus sp. CAU 1782]
MDRHEEILQFIKSFAKDKGYPPTVREIALGVGISPSTTHGHLDRMEIKGLIERDKTLPRAIRIVQREL